MYVTGWRRAARKPPPSTPFRPTARCAAVICHPLASKLSLHTCLQANSLSLQPRETILGRQASSLNASRAERPSPKLFTPSPVTAWAPIPPRTTTAHILGPVLKFCKYSHFARPKERRPGRLSGGKYLQAGGRKTRVHLRRSSLGKLHHYHKSAGTLHITSTATPKRQQISDRPVAHPARGPHGHHHAPGPLGQFAVRGESVTPTPPV